jgi:hypothetical protein
MATASDGVMASPVMGVEGSPRPETGPSTHTPCAISATPHKADIHLRDSHVCLGPLNETARAIERCAQGGGWD